MMYAPVRERLIETSSMTTSHFPGVVQLVMLPPFRIPRLISLYLAKVLRYTLLFFFNHFTPVTSLGDTHRYISYELGLGLVPSIVKNTKM